MGIKHYLKLIKGGLVCLIFSSFYGLISSAERPEMLQYSEDKKQRRPAPSGAILVADRPKQRKREN
jgi:hypothetical protein